MVNFLFPSSSERVNVVLKPHSNRAEPTPLVKPLLGQGLASPLSCSGPLWLKARRIPPASPCPGADRLAGVRRALALALKRTQWARHSFHGSCPGFKPQLFTASSRAVGL